MKKLEQLASPQERDTPPMGGSKQTETEQPERLYTLPGLEGEWRMQQLVEMELQHDPRLAQVRRKALPPEFWDARRRALNHNRLQRNYSRRKRRGDELRQEESERLAGMDTQQQAEYQAQKEAEREAAKSAAAAQRERVAQAMYQGLRVVVDCSLSTAPDPGTGIDPCSSTGSGAAASDREVRSLCKQLELCAAANKRATRPVSLRFTGFTGAVKRFALEGMHADRWPAARGHEEQLQYLFPAAELVVLSPDARQPLITLDPEKVYVIGGLVDRTVQKGASLKLAQRCGAAAVRLPIAEHLGQLAKGKGVLNVNDVFLALLAVHAGEGWREALERAIPQRFRPQQQPMLAAGTVPALPAAAEGGHVTAEQQATLRQHVSEQAAAEPAVRQAREVEDAGCQGSQAGEPGQQAQVQAVAGTTEQQPADGG